MPPRIHPALIPRERLLARLDASLGKKMTLVCAPTGFGKTTLVSMWLAERRPAFAWVTLDENDNDPVRFWTYAITALRRLNPKIGKTALAALSTSQTPSFQTILTAFINDLAELSGPLLLALEDYQSITSADIYTAIAYLLQHMPDALHLVILSRAEPDLPLGLLRARNQLLEISAAELRFDRAETETFLRKTLDLELQTLTVEMLQQRTEGWPAGLRLASLVLQNNAGEATEQVIQSFSGGHRFVTDYLIREVFESQPEPVQEFLLKTCFLNKLTGSLCDAITGAGNGESVLEKLEKENLFLVRLEHERGRAWYRYNQLFAESIQALARQRLGEAGVQSVFERASAWFAAQQIWDDAIEMALAADLYERALDLVETFIEIYNLNEMRTLTRWMERIPRERILQRPSVCMMYAQVILFTSDRFAPSTAARIEPYLRAAEKVWGAQGDEEKVGTTLALRGMILLWQGEFEKSLENVYRSLEKMGESEIFWRGVSLLNAAGSELYAGQILSAQDHTLEARALLGASQNQFGILAANGILSEIFFAQGDMEPCTQLNQQIMAEAVGEESMLDDQGEARLRLSRVAYEQNDLASASRYAAEACDLAEQRANELLQAQALGQLALVQAAGGEETRAREELKLHSAKLQSAAALAEIRMAEALLAARSGENPAAWLTSNQADLPSIQERATYILARGQIMVGRPVEALASLEPVLAQAAAQGRLRGQIQALCLIALAQQAAGNFVEAAKSLSKALTIGHEKGFRRTFLDEGAPMASLLREILPSINKPLLTLYIKTLLQLFFRETAPTLAVTGDSLDLVEPLSQQEIRVLKLLAVGLSNSDIANELVVSVNTVKTHVKSIYRKLNIRSREEARLVVKELKLM